METKEPKWRKLLQVASNAAMINALFILCCIPVVTIGQAWAGLYSAVRYAIRGDGWFAGFKAGFKTRFLRGTVAWTVCLLVIVEMSLNMMAILGENPVIVAGHGLFLLIALMICGALIPLNVYIPGPVTQWLKNAINLIIYAPLQTVGVAVLMWLPTVLVVLYLRFAFFDPFFFIMVFLFAYFSFSTLIATVLLKNPLIRIKQDMEQLQQGASEEVQ